MVLYSGGRYGSGNAGDEIKVQSCDLDIRDVQGDSFCVSQLSCDPIYFVFNAGRAGLIFLGGHTAVPNSIGYITALWSTRRLTPSNDRWCRSELEMKTKTLAVTIFPFGK